MSASALLISNFQKQIMIFIIENKMIESLRIVFNLN